MKVRKVLIITGILLAGAAVGLYVLLRGGMPVRHVIIISMDTARADHFGCSGNSWVRTPEVDALSKESLLFTNYHTVTPVTLPSHASLFTGKYPINHGVPANGYMVNKKNNMLAEILKAKGFRTVGFIGGFPLSKWFDIHQGFDYYDERFEKYINDKNVTHHQRSAKQVTDAVIDYFDKNGFAKHQFLFVHYYDPHNPYTPPLKYQRMYNHDYKEYSDIIHGENPSAAVKEPTEPEALQKQKARFYAGEISYMDHHIGRLLNYLKSKHILDQSILVLTSDHGENMYWDRNPFSHGWDTYQGVIKAFCLIRTPGTVHHPKKVEGLVTNIDIMPSLLKYLRLPVPKDTDGQAFAFDGDGDLPVKERYIESSKPTEIENNKRWRNFNNARCIIADGFKYIQIPYLKTEEFYNLAADPFECHNLINSTEPAIQEKIKIMKGKLQKWVSSARPMKSRFQEDQKKETIERLRSLGYL